MPISRVASSALAVSFIACTSSSSSPPALDASLDAPVAPPSDGGPSPADGGSPLADASSGSDGGGGANACGPVGPVAFYGATLGNGTLFYRIRPSGLTDEPMGSFVVGAANLSIVDFAVGDGKILVTQGDAWYEAALPSAPGSISFTKLPFAGAPTVKFIGGDPPVLFGVTAARMLYELKPYSQEATARGIITLPPECDLADFTEGPSATASSFYLLANCASGAANRIFKVTSTLDNLGQWVIDTTPFQDVPFITVPLASGAGTYLTDGSFIYDASRAKVRRFQECTSSGPNGFALQRLDE